MSPIPVKCAGCGRTLQAPEIKSGKEVICPSCGGAVAVPLIGPQPSNVSRPLLDITCKDCGKVFSVPGWEKGQVVECPSCASWVRVGEKSASILQRSVPMPFQVSSSILRWLRFLAGFNLLASLAVVIWIVVYYGTKVVEGGDHMSRRVINPEGVLLAFVAAAWALVGTVILMALYWILQNVTSIYTAIGQIAPEKKSASAEQR